MDYTVELTEHQLATIMVGLIERIGVARDHIERLEDEQPVGWKTRQDYWRRHEHDAEAVWHYLRKLT